MNTPAVNFSRVTDLLHFKRPFAGESLPLIVLGAFAMIWLILRAHLQSVAIDEADTYMYFVHTGFYLWPNPNNRYYHHGEFAKFTLPVNKRYPAGEPAYVLCKTEDQDFIREQRLKIVYHGRRTSPVVAAKV